MQRPASRRAGRRSAPPYGSGSPYGSQPYDQEPYHQEPYHQEPDDQESHRQERYGQEPYGQFYDQELDDQGPWRAATSYPPGQYQAGQHQAGRYEAGQHQAGQHQAGQHQAGRYEAGERPGPWAPGQPAGPARPGGPARPAGPPAPEPGPKAARKAGKARSGRPRRRRLRRLLRMRTVRVILAVVAVFLCWVAFSVGQALAAPNGGSTSTKLAEWARDHYLGPVVTFGEWLTYSPPKVGGKPGFSLAAPSGQAKVKYKATHAFQPIIPKPLAPFASPALPGEGAWRVLETVKGEPAMFGAFLRPDSVHTSYVAGLVSMDQRLVSFQLRPGAEDPGPGNWKAESWIPPGTRTGLVATFNGGFKLDSAEGGFYLNGAYRGSLVYGAASMVYYRNGTMKIGAWGSEVQMTPDVAAVRQNLKLLIDHGKISPAVNQDVIGNWGATLGGGYYVWRSGVGITKGGRIIFVYGPALNAQDLANLLRRAGAVEAMQLDINPEWMSFDYYKASGHPADPTPEPLLPTQQGSVYRYYSVFSRDFTAVYAR